MYPLEKELIDLTRMRFGRRVSTGVRHETHAATDKVTLCYPPYARHDPIVEAVRSRITESHISVQRAPAGSYVEELDTKVSRDTQKVSFLANPDQVASLTSDIAHIRLDMSRSSWR